LIELIRAGVLSTQKTNFYRSLNFFSNNWLMHKQAKEFEKIEFDGGFYKKLFSTDKKEFLGFCVCYPMRWDSKHYGMKMGRLDLSFSKRMTERESAYILKSIVDEAKNRNYDYLCISVVGSSDVDVFLLDFGFTLIEKTVNYLPNNKAFQEYCFNGADLALPSLIREFESNDWDQVEAIIESTHFPSRYTKDPVFEPSKVVDMYVCWLKNLAKNINYNKLFVSIVNKQVVACGGVSIIEDLADSGFLLLGNSILASSVTSMGVGESIVKKTLESAFEDKLSCLFSTSSDNLAMQSILQKTGCQVCSVVNFYRLLL